DATAEAVAARWAEIADMAAARGFAQGAEQTQKFAEAAMGRKKAGF
ncbi:3-oxoacyl-ACP reductase, partial [Candidatus Parcubacteria bacterium]